MTGICSYHQVKFLTPFENACWTMLSQRNLLAVAQHMKRIMIQEFSAGVELDGREFWPFPGAKAGVQASVEDLTRLLRNRRRAEYIHGAAVAFSEVDEAFLREGSCDEVSCSLRRLELGIPATDALTRAARYPTFGGAKTGQTLRSR